MSELQVIIRQLCQSCSKRASASDLNTTTPAQFRFGNEPYLLFVRFRLILFCGQKRSTNQNKAKYFLYFFEQTERISVFAV
jgi:hypothetical protein